jgi:hypothetical protein
MGVGRGCVLTLFDSALGVLRRSLSLHLLANNNDSYLPSHMVTGEGGNRGAAGTVVGCCQSGVKFSGTRPDQPSAHYSNVPEGFVEHIFNDLCT